MSQRNIFWTDHIQARERLQGSFILYGDHSVYVTEVQPAADGEVVGYLTGYTENGTVPLVYPLSDEKFFRFRKPLPLGWVNSYLFKSAAFLERIPTRSRSHGLSDNNVRVMKLRQDGDNPYFSPSDDRFSNIVPDKGYLEACKGIRPTLQEVLQHIRNGTALSFSEKYCVLRDGDGIRWLYKNKDRIGLFSGVDTLLMSEKTSFYKEELQNDPTITIQNIREF